MPGDDRGQGGKGKLVKRSWNESKKMWGVAGPAILTSVLQFSIGFVTVAYAGHLGRLELAAVTVAQGVIEGFANGILLGMASAVETLCGQAVGAGQMHMLGIYLQRSWIITGVTAFVLTPMYLFSSPILKLLSQSNEISDAAGKYCLWVMPELFAWAVNSPVQKFFQSQSRIWVMTAISAAVLVFHVLLNWVLVIKLGYGLAGAALAGDISWWLLDLAQIGYLVSGYFQDSWTGFSLSVFHSLAAFVKLSLASAVMMCLELWYFTIVVLLVGSLKDQTQVLVDVVCICLNLEIWTLTIAQGFNIAVSVRVSNELGAGHPKAAKFSLLVTTAASAFLGIIFAAAVLVSRTNFPKMFTDKPEVIRETSKLWLLLAATILLNSIQSVMEGVAVGAGWQSVVAFVNIGCYYLFGLPFSALLGLKFNDGVKGIWLGVLSGSLLQTVILMWMMYQTNWEKEASHAEERIKVWGGLSEPQGASQKYKLTTGSEDNSGPVQLHKPAEV